MHFESKLEIIPFFVEIQMLHDIDAKLLKN